MKNKKIQLTEKVSLKNLKLEKSQFAISGRILVDFSNARVRNKYDEEKKRSTDEFEMYLANGYEESVGKLAKEGVLELEQLVPIICCFTSESDLIEDAIQKSAALFIELIDFDVCLKWIGQDGRGRYEKYQLVIRDFKISDK